MDADKIKVKLNNLDGCYIAGQVLNGEVTIILLKKTKIKGIKFRITGKGKCSWFDFLRREQQNNSPATKPNTGSISYSAKQVYLCDELYIFGGTSNHAIELDIGEHKYNLNYNLNINLPSSIVGQYGTIKYKCTIFIEKSWSFDEKYSFPITIVKYSLVPRQLNLLPQLVYKQITHVVGVINGGPVTLSAQLPSNYIVRNEKIKLLVTVDNRSSTTIEKLKFSIKQLLTFYSQQPTIAQRAQMVKIFKKETGGILKKTMREFHYELDIPSCQPTENERHIIIHVGYEIQVNVILPGFYKNFSLTLPLIIYSVDNISNNVSLQDRTNYGINYFSPNNSIRSVQSPYRNSTDRCSVYSGSTIADSSLASNIELNIESCSISGTINSNTSRYEYNSMTRSINDPSNVRNESILSNNSRTENVQHISAELPPTYDELFQNVTASSAPSYSDLSK